MGGESFASLPMFEQMPLRKWLGLVRVHNQLAQERNDAMERGRKN